MKAGRRTIPEIRERIKALADSLPAELAEVACELRALAEETKRVQSPRKAAVRSPPMSLALIAKIRAVAAMSPRAHLQDIATVCGVNLGRVSEVLNGKR